MLIHKASKGILEYCWNHDGTAIIHANFKNFPELNNGEWFEVNSNHHYYRTALMYYPDIILIINDGVLVDIVKDKTEHDDYVTNSQMKDDALDRGYIRDYKRLPSTGLLDFISDALVERSIG